jgi:pimeloyl-ACP methyl ester carboxylesterase
VTRGVDRVDEAGGHHVAIDDTRLFVVERGAGTPVIVLHGGPGLDHHEFADYLDPLAERSRLILVDLRSQGRSDHAPEHTWTLERMAQDVIMLAGAMELDRYVVLGHSFGAFVALQNALDYPRQAIATIISCGVPSMRYLAGADEHLRTFEPAWLRDQVTDSWAREADAQTSAEFAAIIRDQWPFHFADPLDPRIEGYAARSAGILSPDVLRHFSAEGSGGIEVEDRLAEIATPTLVLAGRHDRTCVVEAAEAMAAGIPGAELVVFERSGHMPFVEETEAYLAAVGAFVDRVTDET